MCVKPNNLLINFFHLLHNVFKQFKIKKEIAWEFLTYSSSGGVPISLTLPTNKTHFHQRYPVEKKTPRI